MRDQRELKAIGLGALIVFLYLVLVLASGRVNLADFGYLYLAYLFASFSMWLMTVACAAGWWITRERPSSPILAVHEWIRGRWQRDFLISLFWPPVLFASLMISFNDFKQMILPVAGFRFDPLFADLDRLLALGHDPWRVTHFLFGSPTATWFLDKAYHGWFLPMVLGVMVCAVLPAASYRLRTQYMLSYIMTWIGVGSVIAFLLPAAGPCFYQPLVGPAPEFVALMDKLVADQAALGSPIGALTIQEHLLSLHGVGPLTGGAGISAMPSVHNGLAILFAFAAFRINRKAGWAMTIYAGLIWIGSIHLGWHYAIDGIASLALSWGIWVAAGRVADWLARPATSSSPLPATA
jgi:hypothetical protein